MCVDIQGSNTVCMLAVKSKTVCVSVFKSQILCVSIFKSQIVSSVSIQEELSQHLQMLQLHALMKVLQFQRIAKDPREEEQDKGFIGKA